MSPIDHHMEGTIQAWVDGQLPADERTLFEIRLRSDLETAARALAYRAQAAALRTALQSKFATPLPARLQPGAIASAARRRRLQPAQAAAIVTALLIGGGGGSFTTLLLEDADAPIRQAPAGLTGNALQAEAIAAHLVYTVDARHPVEIGAARQEHLIRWLSKRLGKTLIAPDLDKVGYRLVGGRLLPAIEGPAAQLMYEDDEGGRLTVYLRADPASRETAFAFARVNGVNGFRWVDRGFGYAIFGDADHDRMLLAAKAVYEQIEAI